MARPRIVLRDTSRFKDPANLSWERYIALQARERERYLAERATLPEDALAYRTVSPRYLERAVDQFANNYYSELSATHYIATAAANAPFDELKKCCLFQLADEQRHLEMDAEVFHRAGIPERDWLPAWEAPGTTCRFFRHVLELEDSVEILVKANFVAEGAAYAIEPQVETREIDGRRFQVVERRRTPAELTEMFGAAGFSVEVTSCARYVHLTGQRDRPRVRPRGR